MYADVLVQYGVKSLDHTFTYYVPEELRDDLKVGMKVSVGFGRQNINGFVLNIHDDIEESDFEIKSIESIINKDLKLNSELMELGFYIKDKTLCTLITAYQTMLPTALKINNSKECYDKYISFIELNKNISEIDEYIDNNKKGKKQNEILQLLKNGPIKKSELKASSSINKLLELELIKENKVLVNRLSNEHDKTAFYPLTPEQNNAYEEIISRIDSYNVNLLHGVTGSGKTEVYMHLCDYVVKQGKTVIILVPEISLTTQIVKRFYERFNDDVAIFHSNLNDGEKYEEYKKILNNKVHIVVGTRSAIFVPLENIGLIIIDEEHTQTYKQDNNPRYHAIDIAKKRCEYHNCPLVLGSATPSLESMARASKGVYNYVPLLKRVGEATLPDIELVDMSLEYKKRNMILSDKLKLEIMATLERGEQVMLLLNRRGYSTLINCVACGYTYKCPHCDISLTYHKTSNNMRCHYCGYTVFKSEICPECKEKGIRDYGLGTEKLEKELNELYPSYRIVRMDADTTSRKGSHESIIKGIENHEFDIVVGTQMISKGLDFPKVTLVGIINADESLNIPDFRSGENTFSLLSQVSGRAGRSNLKGKVIIQTFNPENKTLNYVVKNDYIGNYNYEMGIRKLLKYPPYYYLIGVKVTSKDYESASKESIKVASYLKGKVNSTTVILGPTTANQFRINNVYRFQIVIKYRNDPALFIALKELDNLFIVNKLVNLEIDVDPLRI